MSGEIGREDPKCDRGAALLARFAESAKTQLPAHSFAPVLR